MGITHTLLVNRCRNYSCRKPDLSENYSHLSCPKKRPERVFFVFDFSSEKAKNGGKKTAVKKLKKRWPRKLKTGGKKTAVENKKNGSRGGPDFQKFAGGPEL